MFITKRILGSKDINISSLNDQCVISLNLRQMLGLFNYITLLCFNLKKLFFSISGVLKILSYFKDLENGRTMSHIHSGWPVFGTGSSCQDTKHFSMVVSGERRGRWDKWQLRVGEHFFFLNISVCFESFTSTMYLYMTYVILRTIK